MSADALIDLDALLTGVVPVDVAGLPWLLLAPSPVPHTCAVCVAGAVEG